MKAKPDSDASKVYKLVLASAGTTLPLTVSAIDPAPMLKAARQYCEPLFLRDTTCGVIAGGFVRDSLMGVLPNDLDLYATRRDCAKLARRLMIAGWRLHAVNSVPSTWCKDRKSVQLLEFHGNAAQCIERFDLTICCAALDLRRGHVVCADTFLPDLDARRLVVHDPALPSDTLRRVARFVRQGFTISWAELRELKRRIILERCLHVPCGKHVGTQFLPSRPSVLSL